MRYAYYPGCSAESTARDLHTSSVAVAHELGIELIEPDGWSCCGSTPAHQTDRILAASLPAFNLILAKEMGLELPPTGKEAQKLVEQVKLLESRGYQYEGAEASFELLVHRAKPDYKPPFELVDFMVVVEARRRPPTHKGLEETLSEAVVKVRVGTV